jgi:hypothetical protein
MSGANNPDFQTTTLKTDKNMSTAVTPPTPEHPATGTLNRIFTLQVKLTPELRKEVQQHHDLLVDLFQPCQSAEASLVHLQKEEVRLQVEIENLEDKPWDDKQAAAESATKKEQLARLRRQQQIIPEGIASHLAKLTEHLRADSNTVISKALSPGYNEIRAIITDYLSPFCSSRNSAHYLAGGTTLCHIALVQLQRHYGDTPLRDAQTVIKILEEILAGKWPFEIARPVLTSEESAEMAAALAEASEGAESPTITHLDAAPETGGATQDEVQ